MVCRCPAPLGLDVPGRAAVRTSAPKEARDDQGVTMVGLVVVVVILALLVTAVLLGVGTTRSTHHELALPTRAAFVSCRSTVAAVKAALQVYRAETATGSYPATLADLAASTGQANGPVLKQAPQAAAGALTKDGWALVSYDRTRGTFEVATARGPTRPTGTPTVCKGA